MGSSYFHHALADMRKRIFALIDCNNFYVSCERVFNASIQNKPVIVMSNNDGCVVARSNEVKKLGVKMGQPVFQIQDLIKKHHIHLFSSNYPLYQDMSGRVMKVLATITPILEVYSIDEAFIDLTELKIIDLTVFGRMIKAKVFDCTGIPVSVGIASSKTLTKIASEIVKKDASFGGVLDLFTLCDEQIDEYLAKVEIGDIWYIGHSKKTYLSRYGISTARDLKYTNENWIKRVLTVVGQRTVLELRGIACSMITTEIPPKKNTATTKTFGQDITSLRELEEAVATYTARAAEKLRSQDSLASELTVFIRTNYFNKTSPQYFNSISLRIPFPTAFTPELIKHALIGLEMIYEKGYKYKKAGVIISRIIPQDTIQPDLFGEFSVENHNKKLKLMYIVDEINKWHGRDTLYFAVQGTTRPWKMQQGKLSNRFTTSWNELMIVR